MTSSITRNKLLALYHDGHKRGLSDKELQDATVQHFKPSSRSKWFIPPFIVIIVVGIILKQDLILNFSKIEEFADVKELILSDLKSAQENFLSTSCLIDVPEYLMEACRPLANCSMCQGIDSAPTRSKITKEEFLREHAYTGKPVLITNETEKWTAFDTFSYDYFKRIFKKPRGEEGDNIKEDSFFPYKTNFADLQHFFRMSKSRQKRLKWYVGWSNSDRLIMEELRKHYQRPRFLPDNSESSQVDWIFMGGSGPGAMIHIDAVSRPSWQAQIKGKKTWYLIPPPECEHVCKPFNITMSKGDIVVVDTNIWYHSTFIHPGEMSITIGSEYD